MSAARASLVVIASLAIITGCTGAPSPAAAPSATGASAGWLEYLDRAIPTTETLLADWQALSAAAGTEDPADILAATTAAGRHVETELAWLVGHVPADCYAPAHDALRSVFQTFQKALTPLERWAAAYPDGEVADLSTGLAYVGLLGTDLDAAKEAFGTIDC